MDLIQERLFDWPASFRRIPDEDWSKRPISTEGMAYAELTTQRWYSNLELTLKQLRDYLEDGDIVVDYSAGTGILAERWFANSSSQVGWLLIDASGRFLRVAAEKFASNRLVAARLLNYLKAERRLQFLDEVLPQAIVERKVDAIVSTNAVHLYSDLPETFAAWSRVLRRGGKVFVQSGNMLNRAAAKGTWIIHDTVEAIYRNAVQLVKGDARYAKYRATLEDPGRMAAHEALRRKYFLEPRTVDEYCQALNRSGLSVERVTTQSVDVVSDEWLTAIGIYSEGILGWIGGTQRIDGRDADAEDQCVRTELIRRGLETFFRGRVKTQAAWTYITCYRA